MRAAILGAGAMGGYYGARLAKAGEDVVFVARGAHLQALKSHGLRVRTADTESVVRVTTVDQTDAVGPVDLVLFCVKSYDAPIVEELAREYEGQLTVMKLDVDENPQTALAYRVQSIPTLLVFKDGQLAERIVGAVPKRMIVDKLQSVVA